VSPVAPAGGPAAAGACGARRAPPARRVLDNGLTLVVQESPSADVVAMTLAVGLGSRDETPESSGATALLGRVLLKGTRRRSAVEIARAAEDAGGVIESSADQEYAEIQTRGLARHWPELLALLDEVVGEPALEAAEVEREREALLAQIRALDDQPFQVASRLLARALYGERGYGLPSSGTAASVTRLTRDDLRAHLETGFVPGRMVLAVSGAVEAGAVLAEAAGRFGARPVGVGGAPEPAPRPGRPWKARDRETRPTQQAQLLVGYLAPPIGEPDHVATKVLNAVLGSGMSSRLFRTLREDRGLAYAVGSYFPTRRGSSRIVLHIGTAPENLAVAESGLEEVIGGLRETPVASEELARAQTSLVSGLLLDLRTSARRSAALAFHELMGVGAGYLDRYPELVLAVTAAEVQAAARRHLVAPAVVTVGPVPAAG
jgi:zinc protease